MLTFKKNFGNTVTLLPEHCFLTIIYVWKYIILYFEQLIIDFSSIRRTYSFIRLINLMYLKKLVIGIDQ